MQFYGFNNRGWQFDVDCVVKDVGHGQIEVPGVTRRNRSGGDRVLDLYGEGFGNSFTGCNAHDWPGDGITAGIKGSTVQVGDIGVIERVADIIVESKIIDGLFAIVLGVERVGERVTSVGHGTVGIGYACGVVGYRLVRVDAGQQVLATSQRSTRLTITIGCNNRAVVLAGYALGI